MKKHEIDEKIAEISKSVLSYCMSRTKNQYDAEDLSQDILLELTRSLTNLRDDKAFYGFMWTVADNVYRRWYKKKMSRMESEIPENLADAENAFDALEENEDIYLMRRELAFLAGKYRKATVLYYMENRSCAEISEILDISENMVKYLLFKARKILKEGMIMVRNYGEQSYNPKKLNILYMGEGPNRFSEILDTNLIRMNIIWACYNDSLREEEIALQIGISLPYIENDIATLTGAGLLMREGGRYRTNIVIFTEEARAEMNAKAEAVQTEIAEKIKAFIAENIEKVREIGFFGADMSENSIRWLISVMLLKEAYGEAQEKLAVWENPPKTAFGEEAYVYAEENRNPTEARFNTCTIDGGWFCSDIIMKFMDWLPNKNGHHSDFYNKANFVRVYEKLARGIAPENNEFEMQIVAELIKHGYAYKSGEKISVTMPVFTKTQHAKLMELLAPTINELAALGVKTVDEMATVLKNHTPTHLKKQVRNICAISIFDTCVGMPAKMLHNEGYLSDAWNTKEIATSYVILK